jgi:hypothetical protein
MSCAITRFYYNTTNESACKKHKNKAFDDVDTVNADLYELVLQQKEIDYTRIDL